MRYVQAQNVAHDGCHLFNNAVFKIDSKLKLRKTKLSHSCLEEVSSTSVALLWKLAFFCLKSYDSKFVYFWADCNRYSRGLHAYIRYCERIYSFKCLVPKVLRANILVDMICS